MAEDQRSLQQLRETNQQLREMRAHLRALKKQRILEAYEMVDPSDRGMTAEVVRLGGGDREWVVRVGSGIGTASTKKEARMIAIVRSSLDPGFTGDAPACISRSHIASVERKRSELLAQIEDVGANKSVSVECELVCNINVGTIT